MIATAFLLIMFHALTQTNAFPQQKIWISCKSCQISYQDPTRGFDIRCTQGCDRFFTSTTKEPITNLKTVTYTIKGGHVRCEKCFGHGVKAGLDPRCRSGCGRIMTMPPTYPITGTEFSVEPITDSLYEEENSLSKVEFEPTKPVQVNNFLFQAKAYNTHLFVLFAILAGLISIIAGYILYKRSLTSDKEITLKADNIAFVVHDLYQTKC